MENEIERKFFVRIMPDMTGQRPRRYERYILSNVDGKETRISSIDGECVYEEKSDLSSLERVRTKKVITREEFDALRRQAGEGLVRDRYQLPGQPEVALQVYHGRFEGLIRAEVEFASREEAEAFNPLSWMGREMTGLPIARDAQLVELTDEEFRRYLQG